MPGPLYSPVSRNVLPVPVETSALMSPRDPQALSHLWKFTSQGNERGKQLANQNSAIIAKLNSLTNPRGVTTGVHPFQIYQMPSVFRPTASPTDYLKFRIRTGGFLTQIRSVPSADVGTAIPDPGSDPFASGGWQGTGFYSNIDQFRGGSSEDVKWDMTFVTGGGTGQPLLGSYSSGAPLFNLPYTMQDDVFNVNGGDPEWTMPTDSVAWFWLSLDLDGDGNTSAAIHWGGFHLDTFALFGSIPPWIQTSGGDYIGNLFSLPAQSNLMGNYWPLGDMTNVNGKVWVGQYVNDHLITLPDNFFRYVGGYDDSVIYWTGDIVSSPAASTDLLLGFGYFVQLAGYSPSFDNSSSFFPTDCRGLPPIGISGTDPSDDTTAVYWKPLIAPGNPQGASPWPSNPAF